MRRIKRGEGLNIVPFIDIMLVLLAIVLSISTFIVQGQIKIDIPQAKSKESKEAKRIEILIDKSNQIYFENQPLDLQRLRERLEGVKKESLIVLVSDKESKFEGFVKILELLQEKGHENFAISTHKK